jgi:hypothetical protein
VGEESENGTAPATEGVDAGDAADIDAAAAEVSPS